MSDIVSDIKSRLNIDEVVSQYVQLKKAGKNFKGLCPFHQEKTPSFMVSPDKQLAYCFGCHRGGDMIKFIEEVEGVDFLEAVNILADRAGLNVDDYKVSQPSVSKSEREELLEIHSITAQFYSDYLWNSEAGKKVLEYLKNRGLTNQTIKDFQVGLAPDSFDETHLFLVKKGYSRKSIVSAGIGVSKDTQHNKIYDRFRLRLIFPIFDAMGRVVAFGGRALKKEDNPKYLNSPESPIYKKGELLYGYSHAKQAVKEKGELILVEGYFDVILSHQEGIKNVAATSGTALSLPQIKLIKRQTTEVSFCFDTDNAGIDAAKRGFELAQAEKMNIRVINVPGEKDPADFINHQPDKWQEIIQQKVPFMDFCIKEIFSKNEIKTIEGQKKVLKQLLPYIHLIENSVERDHYIREIAQKLGVKEVTLYDELKKITHTVTAEPTEKKALEKNAKISLINLVFGLLYEYPELLEKNITQIDEKYLDDTEKSIYNLFKDHYNLLRANENKEEFLSNFNGRDRQQIEFSSLLIEEKYSSFSEQMIEKEFEKLLSRLTSSYLDRQRKSLYQKIKLAEEKGDKDEAKQLLQKLQKLVNS